MAKKTSKLEALIESYGAEAVRRGSDIKPMDVIPTGLLSLDMALGCGGWPRGRVVELYGPEGSGKSTLACMAIAEAQRQGLGAIYLDLENSYDPVYAKVLGVDSDQVLVARFADGIDALNALKTMIENWEELAKEAGYPTELGIVVVDSVAAILSKNEVEGDIGDSHVGIAGRLMSSVCRIFNPLTTRKNFVLFYINQLRATINSAPFAPKTTTTGGKALPFYATIRVDVRRVGRITDKEEKAVGANVSIVIAKSKASGNEGQGTTVPMFHGYGFSVIEDIIQLSLDKGLTEQAGAWYTCLGERFQGKDNLKLFLKDNPDKLQELKELITGGKND